MSRSISSLAVRVAPRSRLPLWSLRARNVIAIWWCSAVICGHVWAFTQVTISTAAPTSTETDFLADATNQYKAQLIKNPLSANTYTLKLFGHNPNYQAPAPPPSTLEQALSLGATVYVYGFADGMAYERKTDLGIVGKYIVNLSTSDQNCADVMGPMESEIYSQSYSTPTVIPPPVQ